MASSRRTVRPLSEERVDTLCDDEDSDIEVEVKDEKIEDMIEVKDEEIEDMIEVKDEEIEDMIEVKDEEIEDMIEVKDEEIEDMIEVKDEEIEDMISDLRVVTSDFDNNLPMGLDMPKNLDQEQRDVPIEAPASSCSEQERARTRGRQASGTRGRTLRVGSRGRGRGYSSGRNHSSRLQQTKKEIDEANGWTYEVRERPNEDPVFEEVTRVLAPINENSSEFDCFSVFFNDNFWKLVKTETNRYAGQMKAKQARQGLLKSGSMLYNWKPVTLQELKHFFSIIIHMSLVHKETIDSYWSTREIINTTFSRKIMTRDRFRAIYSCLHLNDNANYIPRGQENYDAFFKLRPYFQQLCQICEQSFYPDEALTIDKPDKYEMKTYIMLSDAHTGYALRMIPYIGDSKTVDQIVTELCEPYFDKWHTVYMDRFFTNPTVVNLFWLKNTRVVGPVMSNRRGLPQEWREQVLETHEMTFCHRGNMTACKYKDKHDVLLLTTKHAASWTEVKAKAKEGPIMKIKPDCILDYNRHKIGADLNDQYVSHYSYSRKSMKWWKKMFFHLTARAMVNAYVLYSKSRIQKRRQRISHFLMKCGEELVGAEVLNDVAGPSHGPHHSVSSSRLIGRHFLDRIPATQTKTVVARVCKVCADTTKKQTGKRGRKETVYYCPDCNIPLCYHPCFKKYHTLKDYTQ